MNARDRISSQSDFDPRHFRFTRQSGLRPEDFESKSDRMGELLLSAVMSGVAVFIVLGLTFGWFA